MQNSFKISIAKKAIFTVDWRGAMYKFSMFKYLFILTAIIVTTASCVQKSQKDMKYTSAITFLYYEDFEYGVDFIEQTLQLELVMDQGWARVYQVNAKAYLGIVKKSDTTENSGNTLFSLTTQDVYLEYERVKQMQVENLTEIKYFESIPLKSFFFDDQEGHKFEIQQFLETEDIEEF